MPLSRRHFIAITASTVALAYKPANAQDDRALFWRIETPDGGRGVVFDMHASPRLLLPTSPRTAFVSWKMPSVSYWT